MRKEGDDGKGDSDSSGSPDEPLQGKTGGSSMIIDASVAPADIAYPTDLNLLNEAREKLKGIIDVLT